MKTNDLLAAAAALTDRDLLARTQALAATERETSVTLVAHLAALEGRPSAFAALGYGSLFAYCTEALRFSEDAACNRIRAARACRRFPVLLDHLATGDMSLTSVRKLGRLLTAENVDGVLARARKASLATINALVAELEPRPDAPTLVRRLPVPAPRTLAGSAPLLASVSEAPERASVSSGGSSRGAGAALAGPSPRHPDHLAPALPCSSPWAKTPM